MKVFVYVVFFVEGRFLGVSFIVVVVEFKKCGVFGRYKV